MKGSLANLPQRKRGELVRIVTIIRHTAPQAEMIILFGSYAAFSAPFPLRTKQKRDRFDPSRQAYVGARYHDDYKITPEELKYLARCVELLKEQTETSCETKMKSFI